MGIMIYITLTFLLCRAGKNTPIVYMHLAQNANENTLTQAVVATCVALAAKPPKRSRLPQPLVPSAMLCFLFIHLVVFYSNYYD